VPLLEQYMLFVQFFLNEQVATFRVTCKMLYLQLNVFLDLAANGFCVPKHLDLEETDELGEKMEKGGMGLAEGEGTTDVSDRIESEDQLEDARLPNQEQEKQEDKICKEEEKGIDMSEDFDSKLQDLEKSDEDEEQSNDEEEENDMDKEMGETGEEAEQLDKEIWGDDEEESDDDNQQPENEDEKEGIGEQIGEEELTAKNDKDRKKQHDKDTDRKNQQEDRKEEDKKEINELNEPEMNDQTNYKPQPETKPETVDSPEDLNIDEDDVEDSGETQEQNLFDEMEDEMDSKSPPRTEDVTPDEEAENDPVEESGENDKEDDENIDKDEQNTTDEVENDKENEQEKNGQVTEIEEEKEDQKETEEEKAVPSTNSATQQTDAAQPIEETTEGSRDAVAQEQSDKSQPQQDALTENTNENSNNDNGYGQSQSIQQESGHSESSKQEMISAPQRNTIQQKKRNKPSKSNEDHTLLDRYEPLLKKQKTLYTQEEMSKNENEEENDLSSNSNEIEMVQHIHKDSQKFDDYTLDAATEDQLKKQATNKDKETETLDDTKAEEGISEDIEMEEPIESEKQMVEAQICKEKESSLHVMECSSEQNDLISNYVQNGRSKLEDILGKWMQMPSTENAIAAWNGLCSITDTAARDLSEKLRLVLEPTQASRLKGDYKTGKRINMRKIISYIASQFRKDKIWLKRTKPSKRDYQVVIAIDDSHSMSYNISSKMTLESLSLISKAMTYLEVGQVGIISFGDEVKLLHPLGETFTEQSGARYFQFYFINLYT